MRTLIVLIASLTAQLALADARIQDNVDYNVSVKENLTPAQRKACLTSVCELAQQTGTGNCQVIFNIDTTLIISANLSSYGADTASRLACVSAVELDQPVQMQPSLGRSN